MSRPKLTSLSELLPSKGSATRPETIASPDLISAASDKESKQASNLANSQRREFARTQPREQTRFSEADDYQTGPRSAVSFRMTERLQERLREYAHQTRRKKQDVLDEALHLFLKREGY